MSKLVVIEDFSVFFGPSDDASCIWNNYIKMWRVEQFDKISTILFALSIPFYYVFIHLFFGLKDI